MGSPFIICLALAGVLVLAAAEKTRYDRHRVITVNFENEKQREIVEQLDGSTEAVQLFEIEWEQAKLIVAPEMLADVEDMFSSEGLIYQVETANLQDLIDNEQPEHIPRAFGWTAYYNLEAIYGWLDEKLKEYPDLLTNYEIGTTYENRTIRAVRLSHKAGNPTVFIESTIHAREWVTVATATYFLNELLTSTNSSIVDLAQNIDWVIIPVLNADGYAYSHSNRRFWRKNRQPNPGSRCIGTDGNRNFNVSYGTIGFSNNPCSEIYNGRGPMSERESIAMSEFLGKFTNTRLFLSFHSFGQLLLLPYGFKRNPSPNHEHLMQIGRRATEAIHRRFATSYRLGSTFTAIYPVSGCTQDYAYVNKNITLSYTFEFRPRAGGISGFALPASQIIPNSLEVIDGLVAMIAEARVLQYL